MRSNSSRPINRLRGIFDRVLTHCAVAPRLGPQWEFVVGSLDAYGPIVDPAAALADLQARFPVRMLRATGIVRISTTGHLEFVPDVVNPAAVLIPLRRSPGDRPFALLGPRGTLPRKYCPVNAAMADTAIAQHARRLGALFASPFVREVQLLRALGFPATLSLGAGDTTDKLRTIDEMFASADGEPAADGLLRPTLVLVAWNLRSPACATPLTSLVTRLAQAHTFLGIPFSGVAAWVPTPFERDAIQYAIRHRAARELRQILRASADGMVDFESLLERPEPPPGQYPDTQAELVAALKADPRDAARVARAQAAYDGARQQLIAGLREHADMAWTPITRIIIHAWADSQQHLHSVTPELLAACRGKGSSEVDRLLNQFVVAAGVASRIVRDLISARKEGW